LNICRSSSRVRGASAPMYITLMPDCLCYIDGHSCFHLFSSAHHPCAHRPWQDTAQMSLPSLTCTVVTRVERPCLMMSVHGCTLLALAVNAEAMDASPGAPGYSRYSSSKWHKVATTGTTPCKQDGHSNERQILQHMWHGPHP
jgi:hypothetical protein